MDYKNILAEGTHIMEDGNGKTVWKDTNKWVQRQVGYGGMKSIYLKFKDEHTVKGKVRMLKAEVNAYYESE